MKEFTFKDFQHGLMLAGIVPPANDREQEELRVLKEFEEGNPDVNFGHAELQRIAQDINSTVALAKCRRNLYIKLR